MSEMNHQAITQAAEKKFPVLIKHLADLVFTKQIVVIVILEI